MILLTQAARAHKGSPIHIVFLQGCARYGDQGVDRERFWVFRKATKRPLRSVTPESVRQDECTWTAPRSAQYDRHPSLQDPEFPRSTR